MTASPYHDAELADTLEWDRIRRKRVRAACSTVPSLSADDHADRIIETIDKIAASGGGSAFHLPEFLANRNGRVGTRPTQAAKPSVATESTVSHSADSASGAPNLPRSSAKRVTESSQSEGRRNPGAGMRGAPQKGR